MIEIRKKRDTKRFGVYEFDLTKVADFTKDLYIKDLDMKEHEELVLITKKEYEDLLRSAGLT